MRFVWSICRAILPRIFYSTRLTPAIMLSSPMTHSNHPALSSVLPHGPRPPKPRTNPMTRAIDRDNQRFKEIVRGKVRGNLKKYITHGEVLGRKGREVVSI